MDMNRFFALSFLCTLMAGLSGVAHADLEVEQDEDNVVASRLIGTWHFDGQLSGRLGSEGGQEFGTLEDRSITFESDPAVAGQVPVDYENFLKDYTIYLAGTMDWGDGAMPFLLITHSGNPHILFFLPEGDDPFGNGESMIVMLAYAEDPVDDILFFGGDFNGQPFAAFSRDGFEGEEEDAE